jgi:hypothetical protein
MEGVLRAPAVRLVRDGLLLRPLRRRYASAKIDEPLLGDIDPERT